MSTKTNEKELASKVATCFHEQIQRDNFPFTFTSSETGVKGGSSTKFGDILI